jgi:hypothetical protein
MGFSASCFFFQFNFDTDAVVGFSDFDIFGESGKILRWKWMPNLKSKTCLQKKKIYRSVLSSCQNQRALPRSAMNTADLKTQFYPDITLGFQA